MWHSDCHGGDAVCIIECKVKIHSACGIVMHVLAIRGVGHIRMDDSRLKCWELVQVRLQRMSRSRLRWRLGHPHPKGSVSESALQ